MASLSVYDITKVQIDKCDPSNSPCSHNVTVTVKDGRTYKAKVDDGKNLASLIWTVEDNRNDTTIVDYGLNSGKHFDCICFDRRDTGQIQRAEELAHTIFSGSPVTEEPTVIDEKKSSTIKKPASSSNWKATLAKVAIIAAIAIGALALLGGLVTGFVFTAIYCPTAAYIIGAIAIKLVILAAVAGFFWYRNS